MAEFGVYLKQITRIDPIPGADAIEAATVGGYQCVVGKGTYTIGQTVLYIPENAVLPDELIERMGLTGRLAGKDKNRVKAVRLRGVLSEGLVYAVDSLMFREDVDHAERLGITKYAPVIPAEFAGQAVNADGGLEPWIEIEAVKKDRQFDFESGVWLDPFDHRQVEASLKVHGTAFCCTMNVDGSFFVSSKGMGSRGVALAESESNVYWRAVRKYDIQEKLASLVGDVSYGQWDRVSLYGEVYGPGVQDLTYGAAELSFVAFDMRLNGRWAIPATARRICAETDIPFVPAIFIGPYNYERMVELAETLPEEIVNFKSKVQEGIVIRTTTEPRRIGKIVSSAYATRKGGTEYN